MIPYEKLRWDVVEEASLIGHVKLYGQRVGLNMFCELFPYRTREAAYIRLWMIRKFQDFRIKDLYDMFFKDYNSLTPKTEL